jgi:hypothetical protein
VVGLRKRGKRMVDIVKIITDFCIKNLDLENAKLGNEYFYQSLPLCVIDAVFSIGIKYQTTQAVVQRYSLLHKVILKIVLP